MAETMNMASAASRGDIEPCPGKLENIIILGSENYYNSFWVKMMFIAPGFGIAANTTMPPGWPSADRTTVLYVSDGYTAHELLPLEFLKDQLNVHLLRISTVGQLVGYLNNRMIDGERHLIMGLLFMAHGLPDRIDLNFWARPRIRFTAATIGAVNANGFCPQGRVFSYACRTGVSVSGESFDALADARPQNSLAQKMADHFNVPVKAFYTRTYFGNCLRSSSQSAAIEAAMQAARPAQNGQVIQISTEHEALPHPGQGTTSIAEYGIDIPFIPSGEERHETSEYSLWRKAGARSLPVAHHTPSGLPQTIHTFEPR